MGKYPFWPFICESHIGKHIFSHFIEVDGKIIKEELNNCINCGKEKKRET